MPEKLNYFAALVATAACATAIATAPPAAASCASVGTTQTICQSPGNAQVYTAVGRSDYYRYTGGVI